MELVTDRFDSPFALLSRVVGGDHRISVRIERFGLYRPGEFDVDNGRSFTLAWQYDASDRLQFEIEWTGIRSTRELWPEIYDRAEVTRSESVVMLGARLQLFDAAR